MKRLLLPALLHLVLAVSACSPAADVSEPGGNSQTLPAATEPAPAPRATFTFVYETYFAPGTAGHCARCHGASARGGFLVGATQDEFYEGLVAENSRLGAPLVDTTNPARSLLIDPKRSPVSWFNPSGPMPDDNPVPNAQAKADIEAWVAAGAKND